MPPAVKYAVIPVSGMQYQWSLVGGMAGTFRKIHKRALALLKIIEENETRASYYKQGSLFILQIMKNGRKQQKRLLKRVIH